MVMTTILQTLALIALIYNGLTVAWLVVTLIKWAVDDWREYR